MTVRHARYLALGSALVLMGLGGCTKSTPQAAGLEPGEAERSTIGLRIAPVPLDTKGLDVALVGSGSYLVNAGGGCNDCHTAPNWAEGGDPYTGVAPKIDPTKYLSGGRQFGPITSRNLTPRGPDRLPAGLTFAEFKWMLQTGEDSKDAKRLLQVMPWPIYGKLREQDMRAIWEYLRAIPPLPDNPSPRP